MKKSVSLVFLFLIFSSLFFGLIFAEEKKEIWTYNGKTLDEVLKDDNLGIQTKQLAIEKAVLDKAITSEQLDYAVEKGIITEHQKKEYTGEGKGLFFYLQGVFTDLWEKSGMKTVYNYLSLKTQWILGARNAEGVSTTFLIIKDFNLRTLIIYALISAFLSSIILAILKEDHKYFWGISGGFLGFFTGIFVYLFVASGYLLGEGMKYLFFMIAIVFWTLIFFIIKNDEGYEGTFDRIVENFLNFMQFYFFLGVSLIFIFLILFGIPIINRFLQIITLEILGVHWFWRSLIIATAIYFAKPLIKSYARNWKRRKAYEEQLEKVAMEEAVKAQFYH